MPNWEWSTLSESEVEPSEDIERPVSQALLSIKRESSEPSECAEQSAGTTLSVLPKKLKSLIGARLRVERREPRVLIELRTIVVLVDAEQRDNTISFSPFPRRVLGRMLGIADYPTNMVQFWFLDTLSLELLRHEADLDDDYTVLLISWLAGEMELIRDRGLSRKSFFLTMTKVFKAVAEKLSRGDPLQHWDLIARAAPFASMERESHFEDRYADELRYALIYAVFVERIEVQVNSVPFTLRTPRPIKLAERLELFEERLHEELEMVISAKRPIDRKGVEDAGKGKSRMNKRATKIGKRKASNSKLPCTPTHSLTEDEQLAEDRKFILPLAQAKESTLLFQLTNDNA
ncbi:hypothetical protein KM043_006106 [Ampulex compressa]|nr:hypothetical protein KM043_006106 [Ampulex compressa]